MQCEFPVHSCCPLAASANIHPLMLGHEIAAASLRRGSGRIRELFVYRLRFHRKLDPGASGYNSKEGDQYITSASLMVGGSAPYRPTPASIWDPACGTGLMVKALEESVPDGIVTK